MPTFEAMRLRCGEQALAFGAEALVVAALAIGRGGGVAAIAAGAGVGIALGVVVIVHAQVKAWPETVARFDSRGRLWRRLASAAVVIVALMATLNARTDAGLFGLVAGVLAGAVRGFLCIA